MLDEWLARDAINLVQKLRKEAHLTPSDPVTVYYEVIERDSINYSTWLSHFSQVLPYNCSIAETLKAQSGFIEAAIKVPWKAGGDQVNGPVITTKIQKLKDVELRLTIVRGSGVQPAVP